MRRGIAEPIVGSSRDVVIRVAFSIDYCREGLDDRAARCYL
jgi:hypothetical protein